MFGEQPFKIGLFSANCSGGLAVTTVPEQWAAEWDEIVELTCLAEDGGLEFILPVAKWKGYGGESDILGRSYETFTHGAALAACIAWQVRRRTRGRRESCINRSR